MQIIKLNQPEELIFGNNCFEDFIVYFKHLPYKRVLVLADMHLRAFSERLILEFRRAGKFSIVLDRIKNEPSVKDFLLVKDIAEEQKIDAVIGLGGGSNLDVAKLTAALCYTTTDTDKLFLNEQITHRKLFLACLPTTAGTGSEVSPNAILLDEKSGLKRGIISPYLLPDAAFIDPVLTCSVPPEVTAATGLDALVHCLEAYANKNAHPITDMYALQGIQLIFNNLEKAYNNGMNIEARAKIALGSMFGGLCLGPVNTAAIHALAYPLGSMYKIPHGLSNAMLLPHVLKVNLASGAERYAAIAKVIGCTTKGSITEVAHDGIREIVELCIRVHVPEKLTDFHVSKEDVPSMVDAAFEIQRLLKNNLRTLTKEDIANIYNKLF